ncbi:F-type H+-transporting ATPase subunit b [Anaerolineae bacterium]|nr:F-type H+-transporting ATPase subunit b [Anaerolineae bacterium]
MDKLGINGPWLLSQIINFFILFFLLWQFAYKPVLGMLDARKKKIQDSLEYAEKVKADAAAQQKEFERKLEETRRETQAAAAAAAQVGEKEREVILAQAREDARKLIDTAKEQIEYERKQMMSDLREEVVSLSLLAAQKVISQSLDDKAHRQLVNDFITQTDRLGKN